MSFVTTENINFAGFLNFVSTPTLLPHSTAPLYYALPHFDLCSQVDVCVCVNVTP